VAAIGRDVTHRTRPDVATEAAEVVLLADLLLRLLKKI